MNEKSSGRQPEKKQADAQNRSLVDVFDAEDTKRISPEALRSHAHKEEKENDIELEERDYRPIRTSRTGRLGCLGGLMYAVFVISISVILACVAWLCACDVLALNKDEASATLYLPREIFSEKEQEVKDSGGKVTGTRKVQDADIDYVADAQ